MRWVRAVACAVGAGACGYPPLPPIDGSIDTNSHVVFTWQLATPLPSGAPAPLSYPPFTRSFMPQIRIAPLNGPFMSAEYRSNAGMEGWIPIPSSYVGTTWRLEYTFLGGVPHEIQWAPDDTGHLTVPMVGRLDRTLAPTGSGYTVTPSNFAGPYGNPRVLTTGLWTDGAITAPITGVTVDYDFRNAKSLIGPIGSPDPSQGDRALLVDFVTDAGSGLSCRVAAGAASFDATLQSGVHTMQTVSWNASRQPVNAPAIDSGFVARLTADPLRGSFNAAQSVQLYGPVPSTDFPGLIGTAPMLAMFRLSIPVMQILLQCPHNRNPLPATAAPPLLDNYPRVLHIQLAAVRSVLGVDLVSGLETVLSSTATAGFKIAFSAPFATRMTLETPTKGTLDLAGASDQLDVGAPAGTFLLKFVPETGLDLRADYHDVILHRITGSGLTTERIFTVTEPRV